MKFTTRQTRIARGLVIAIAIIALPFFVFNRQLGGAALRSAIRMDVSGQRSDYMYAMATILYRPDKLGMAELSIASSGGMFNPVVGKCAESWVASAESVVADGSDSSIVRRELALCYLSKNDANGAIATFRKSRELVAYGDTHYLGLMAKYTAELVGPPTVEQDATESLFTAVLNYRPRASKRKDNAVIAARQAFAVALYRDAEREAPEMVHARVARSRFIFDKEGGISPLVQIADMSKAAAQ